MRRAGQRGIEAELFSYAADQSELRGHLLRVCRGGLSEDHLHGMHVIHRDLNPSNILLSMSGNLLLADCALAKVLPEGQTKTSTFCGSPTYMAPEMIRGRRWPIR